ncbi:hypothetical protein C0J52_01747 [Blattella germanica]|nr:hypothetical protein C0J52_01747 [Blattella germanica]
MTSSVISKPCFMSIGMIIYSQKHHKFLEFGVVKCMIQTCSCAKTTTSREDTKKFSLDDSNIQVWVASEEK